jgi:gliding motility-associated-like protein
MKHNNFKEIRAAIFLGVFILPMFSSAHALAGKVAALADKICPPPPMTFSYTPSSVCADYGLLQPQTSTNFTTGGTYFSSPSGLSISGNGIINTSLTQPGTYIVQYYLPPNLPISTTIVIKPVPNITLLGGNSICAGQSLVLTATGATSYSWSTGVTSNPITIAPSANTNISVIGFNSVGCSSIKSQLITVNQNPTVTVQNATMCAGSSTTLIATVSPTDNVTYAWTPIVSNGISAVVSPSVTRTYTVAATRNGCSARAFPTVTVIPTSTLNTNFSYFYMLCSNGDNPFPILSPNFAKGGVFSCAEPNVAVSPNNGQVFLAGIEPGSYTISYSLAAVGCTLAASNSAVIVISPGGDLSTGVSEVTIEEGTNIELSVSGGSNYNWFPSDFLSCADCDRPVASPTITTRYCVADLANGCLTNACTDVIVVCVNNGDFSTPNAFTPNGDNNNDKFSLQGWSYCVTDFKIMIFDRWGAKVYEATDPNFSWDGTNQGNLLSSGVYVYAITASINRNPISVKKGNITLIR